MDVGFEAYWQMNTRASASSVTAAASRAADMTTREDALRLAVRQAKPASRLEKTMHRAMRRTQDMSMSLSSWSSSTSASSSSQDAITSSVQLAELISAVKRGDETACTHWAGLAAQPRHLDQRAERHRSGGAFLLCTASVARRLQCRRHIDPPALGCRCQARRAPRRAWVAAAHAMSVARVRFTSQLRAARAAACGASCRTGLPWMHHSASAWPMRTSPSGTSRRRRGSASSASALRLSAQRAHSTTDTSAQICRALLSRGADGSTLQVATSSTSTAMTPLLQVVRTAEGDALDCPICLSEVLIFNSVWTPCCATPFHDHCLTRQTKCPMCRTALPAGLCDNCS